MRPGGLFEAAGAVMARGPGSLLARVFLIASAVTAVLSLDATVVLLTPVVFATVARLHARPKPHVYACTHLANTASLLLPVSNLTNLLAYTASGLSFTRFGALMAIPWLAAIAVEYLIFACSSALTCGLRNGARSARICRSRSSPSLSCWRRSVGSWSLQRSV